MVLLLIVIALLAPVIANLVGQDPEAHHEDLIDPLFGTPTGSLGGISGEHWLGVEPVNGRDIFARILYGARISLLVGFLSAIVAVVIGTVLGVLAGFFGGWVDSLISRVMDGLLAFPQLLFIIALVSVMPNNMLGLTGTGVRLFVMILVIGFFGWPYIGRVVRGQTLSMREREYVEAARSLGAGRFYILFKELLPNLVAPIIVYTTMMIPTNILTEAALSFLGVGVEPHGLVGADALERDRLLRLGPHVHGDPGRSDLHHRARLQPLRRRRA
ncbi:ABC transporter permease OS=Streptomyces tendae OX=1932 GN=F3L20_06610 PE=3 SV=1 [Streptomyces tendae]